MTVCAGWPLFAALALRALLALWAALAGVALPALRTCGTGRAWRAVRTGHIGSGPVCLPALAGDDHTRVGVVHNEDRGPQRMPVGCGDGRSQPTAGRG